LHACSLLGASGAGADASDPAAGYTAVYCLYFNKDFIMKLFAPGFFDLLFLAGCGQKGPLYLPAEKTDEPRTQAEEAMIQQPSER